MPCSCSHARFSPGAEADVGLGPAARPLVLGTVEAGRAEPVLQRQLVGVLDPHAPLLGAVDEHQPAERPERLAAQVGLGLLVEQDHAPAGVGQLRRRHQAREPGADDDDVRLHPQARFGPLGGSGLFRAEDLREGRAAHLELALVGLARPDHALDLEAGAADGARGAGLAVALAPGEHLDGRGGRGERDGAAGQRPRTLDHAAQQQGAGHVGGEHRRDQVRAAAVVLLVGVGRVRGVVGRLVGGDRLVLDAVVLRQLARAQREHGGRERDQRRGRLAAHAAQAPAQLGAADRRGGRDADHRGALEGQLGGGQGPLDERDHGERLAEADDAAHARDGVDAVHARLAARRDLDRALLVAHGGGPVRRAVHEQAVAQRHPAEAELAFGDRTQERSLLGSSWKNDAATPRSRTSMRSSSEWISGQAS